MTTSPFSFLLRPKIAPSEVSSITPLAGLAVCKAIREFTGLDCRIKWPNDIIIGKKKLVGILTEMSAEFDAVEYVITGIEINADTQDFPDDIKEKATSIYLATGGHFDKNKFFACVLNHIEEEFIKNGFKAFPCRIKGIHKPLRNSRQRYNIHQRRKVRHRKSCGSKP